MARAESGGIMTNKDDIITSIVNLRGLLKPNIKKGNYKLIVPQGIKVIKPELIAKMEQTNNFEYFKTEE